MKIAIASHKRPEQIQKKTLNLLKKHKFNMKDVYVFVSTASLEEYTPISKKWGFNLILSKNTILDTRNHIIQYFNEGEKIVEMDDDVEDVETTMKGEKNTSVKNIKKLFEDSYNLIESHGKRGLWGFNANTNNFYADGKDKFGLYSIINSCCGYINDKSIQLTVSEKEDFERCAIMFKKNYPILKRCGFGIKTNYWKNKGGIQSHYDFDKRKEVQSESAVALMKKYPEYCYTRTRPNGIVDIRFKRLKYDEPKKMKKNSNKKLQKRRSLKNKKK
tara:strand:+ start:700 stop:1521 length:822 start_codon:yes stop_codon:yes gene_type:complete